MKITIEPAQGEPEVILRGDAGDARVQKLIALLGTWVTPERLVLYREEREYLYDACDVSHFCTEGGHVTAYIGGERYESHSRLYELAEQLKTRSFIQISKSVLVNAEMVRCIEAEFSGNYTALLRDGKTKLTISRLYMRDFRKHIMGGN